jgi:LPXTG-site transpeptidase (sortase) family protein
LVSTVSRKINKINHRFNSSPIDMKSNTTKVNLSRLLPYIYLLGSLFFGLFFIVAPFYPTIEFEFNKKFYPEKFKSNFYAKKLPDYKLIKSVEQESENKTKINDNSLDDKSLTKVVDPEEKKIEEPPKKYFNDIIIPSIALDISILEGSSDSLLDRGAWLKPNGKTPGQDGNTIITGHRYQYFNGVRPFYNLDKVAVGDELSIIWKGEKIDYIIEKKITVNPEDVWIENQKNGKYLTVYTCQGLDAAKRVVVIAKQL